MCGCCEGVERLTPQSVDNPPGRAVLAYRVGTHGRFLASMMAALSDPDLPALAALTKRDPADPAIALLDLGASVADIVAFYQERIANEGYLRTATERRSVLELARLVGYRLRPGVAASGYLAFTVDKDPADPSDPAVTIPAGTKAQSVPGPGEQAQTFETAVPLDGRWSWNDLTPRTRRPTVVTPRTSLLWFDGVSTGLKPGDRLVLTEQDVAGPAVRVVAEVTPLLDENRTTVRLTVVPPARVLLHAAARMQVVALAAVVATSAAGDDAEAVRANILKPLGKQLDKVVTQAHRTAKGQVDAARLAKALDGPVATARAELRVAIARFHRQSPALAHWLAPVAAAVNDAFAVLERAADLGTEPAAAKAQLVPAPAAAPAPPPPGTFNVAARGQNVPVQQSSPILRVVGGLLETVRDVPRPALPSPTGLPRVPAKLFQPSSDVLPQLAAELIPGADRALYPALAGAAVSAPVADEVEAPQLKASPFGATAPRQPVLDASGRAVGSTEWPLTEDVRFAVSLDTSDSDPIDARVAITAEGDTDGGLMRPGTEVALATGRVAYAVQGSDATLRFTVEGQTEQVMKISRPNLQTVRVEVGNLEVQTQSSASKTAGGVRLRVSIAQPDGNGSIQVTAAWERLLPPADPNRLDLDAAYDEVVPGTWVVVERGVATLATRVLAVETVVRTDYGLSAKVTRLTLADPWLTPADVLLSDIRSTAVYLKSKRIPLGWEPDLDLVQGNSIELDGVYDGLKPGRWVIVTGERADTPGTTGLQDGELSMIAGVKQTVDAKRPGDKVHTVITLARKLAHTYVRATVTVWGNVVKATHGETTNEPLGSGTGQAGQRFSLRQKPVTYLAADTPLGAASTLEVRVDGVKWHEQPDLLDAGPRDHSFTTITADDDTTTVVFGDGLRGARPPTGTENVTSVYRKGIGSPGNVAARRVSQMLTRPLRVSGVVNPLSTSGGVDRDNLDQARRNTPIGVRSLGRLVSLSDYEDFACARAGIGKASARRLSDGHRSVVHLTVAAAGGVPMDTESDTYVSLRKALAKWGDPQRPVVVALRRLSVLLVSAGIRIDPDRSWDLVEPAVRGALLAAFSFDRRQLGQDVVLSEVIAAAQAVPGVAYVDVDGLAAVDESTPLPELGGLAQKLAGPPVPRLSLPLAEPGPKEGEIAPAALGLLLPTLPQTLLLREITS